MKAVARLSSLWVCLGLLFLVVGCGTTGKGSGAQEDNYDGSIPEELRPGEQITVHIHNAPPPPVPPQQQRIKEDGTISLTFVGTVKAAGLTPRELQDQLRKLYIPKYYKDSVSITVEAEERFFFVDGEVRNPNRFPYTPGMTVLKAIATSSGFTVYANKTDVELVRADGTIKVINANKARKDPKLDLKVFPNDRVNVRKSNF